MKQLFDGKDKGPVGHFLRKTVEKMFRPCLLGERPAITAEQISPLFPKMVPELV